MAISEGLHDYNKNEKKKAIIQLLKFEIFQNCVQIKSVNKMFIFMNCLELG